MNFNSELMKKLSECISPSGRENSIRQIINDEIKEYVDEIKVDALGNLIAHKKGNEKKIMFAAHMDQIGMIVTFIDDNGFLRFSNVGGLNPYILLGQRVIFSNEIEGVISSEKLENYSDLKLNKLYIDIGVLSKEEAERKIKIGDICVYKTEYYENNNFIMCKASDDRIGCYLLIEAIKQQVASNYNISYVFTVQEEVGLRGAKTSSYNIEPDIAISIDVTGSGDTPKGVKMAVKLGDGTAIKVKDNSLITHPEIKDMLTNLAKKNNIEYQFEVLEHGGTDSGAIHLTKSGIPSGVISIPTRYIHTGNELINKHDVIESLKLIISIIKK